ncbi:MAG: TonB family protein [Acidobacteriota bacterium]
MGSRPARETFLEIPLIRERYGTSLLASLVIHTLAFLLVVLGARLFPKPEALWVGTGPGGGAGGEVYTVGVADDLGGGEGMTKPSLIPQPPAAPEPVKEDPRQAPVSLPDTAETPKPKKKEPARQARKTVPPKESNVIPAAGRAGAGGSGGTASGGGGGRGGGTGISIGSGTGGWGDSWYARAVESRIGSNWIRPVDARTRVEIIYSFNVGPDGRIYNIQKVQSSGNEALDLTAERAIRASNPLTPPPPELRGRPLEFAAQFVYPPNP